MSKKLMEIVETYHRVIPVTMIQELESLAKEMKAKEGPELTANVSKA